MDDFDVDDQIAILTNHNRVKRPRGFAALSDERRRAMAAKGGHAAQKTGRAFRFNSEKAREAGAKGGRAAAAIRDMAALGRKGGLKAGANRRELRAPTMSEGESQASEFEEK